MILSIKDTMTGVTKKEKVKLEDLASRLAHLWEDDEFMIEMSIAKMLSGQTITEGDFETKLNQKEKT